MNIRAIRIHQTGGPEVMRFEEIALADPAPGEARVRHTAIGVNYLDTYHRSGLYPLPLPAGIGSEAAGVVEAVGPQVDFVKPGDRVAYCMGPVGSYSEARNMPADRLVPLPADIADRDAAALMLKGLTVQYLLRQTYPLKGGETILFHAAAGGVGLIACQWARALGVTLIGTAGSDEKAAIAKANGAAHVIVYTRENFVDRVKELTGGKGVPVVYDSIGKDTFPASLDCLKPLGTWVSFGQASGPVPPFNITLLSQKGSLFATRPSLNAYIETRKDLVATANELFDVVAKGTVKIAVNQTYPLAEAAQAQSDLEARLTTGSTVLLA
jgi:NADPH2:quinone reductase